MTEQPSAALTRAPIDWRAVQKRLGVKVDGNAGPVTYAVLLGSVAGRPVPLAAGLGATLASYAPTYAIDANANRLAAFLGQTCLETGGFTLMRETWGPTASQRNYEGSAGLGNTDAGDGFRFRGRGLLMLTGRANYADFGKRLGLDLTGHPELVEQPDAAVRTALEFWKVRNLNSMADFGDDVGTTRRINGGTNGLAERIAATGRARRILA